MLFYETRFRQECFCCTPRNERQILLVIGNRDLEANAVRVRVHGQGNLGAKPRGEVVAEILALIKERGAN